MKIFGGKTSKGSKSVKKKQKTVSIRLMMGIQIMM